MPAPYSGERPWRRSRNVALAAIPAAGADWSVTVPGGHVWELLAVRALLTASAVVANRAVALVIGAEGLEVARVPLAANITASQAIAATWAGGASAYGLGTAALAPLPPLVLEAGATIAVATTGLDVGDQWSAIRLYVVDTMVQGGAPGLADLPRMVVEIAGPQPG